MSQSSPRFLIYGSSPTSGDEAICIGLVNLLRSRFDDCAIFINSSVESYRTIQDWFPDITISPQLPTQSQFDYSLRPLALWKLAALDVLFSPLVTVGRLHPYWRYARGCRRHFDAVVFQGGPGLKSHAFTKVNPYSIALQMSGLCRAGVKAFALGPACGPFSGIAGLQRRSLRSAFARLSLIAPRDPESFRLVKDFAPEANIAEGADTAIGLFQHPKVSALRCARQERPTSTKLRVGLNFRDFQSFYSNGEISEHLDRLTHLTSSLTAAGHIVVPLPMDDDQHSDRESDVEVLRAIFTASGIEYNRDSRLGAAEVLEVASTLDLIVSVRLHPIILCSLVGVPFISLGYTDKCEQYVSVFPRGAVCLPLNDFNGTGDLTTSVTAAMDKVIGTDKFVLSTVSEMHDRLTEYVDKMLD